MTALTQIRSRELAHAVAKMLQRMTGERTIARHGEHGWVLLRWSGSQWRQG